MMAKKTQRGILAVAVCVALSVSSLTVQAEMFTHQVADSDQAAVKEKKPEPPKEGAVSYNHGSFTVTPVNDCFNKLKSGEASEVRRDYESPWVECQRRLKAREAAEEPDSAATDKKDGENPEKDAEK